MISRTVRRALAPALRSRLASRVPAQRRWRTPAPKKGDGPLMSRVADRELPDVEEVTFRWRRTLPLFAAIVTVCSLAIFNYQKMSSPVVASTLYALRVSPRARELLGDEIYFKRQIPWIRGTMAQMHGRIDIWFPVRGSRGTAVMRFASHRRTMRGVFETTEWSLTTEDGEWIDLLEGGDPFQALLGDSVDHVEAEAAALPLTPAPAPEYQKQEPLTRGFRSQQPSYK